MVESVQPTSIPPPMSIVMEVAFAEMTAPMKEIAGGPMARYFLSRTSDRRPTMGERTLCIRSGPCRGPLSKRSVALEEGMYLNDPASNLSIPKVSDDEPNDRPSRNDDKHLSHNPADLFRFCVPVWRTAFTYAKQVTLYTQSAT